MKGKGKILVFIEIDENGKMKIPKTRSTHKILDEYTRKLLLKLSIFSPAEHNKEKISVTHTFPIVLDYD